jgi:hypothetical protein
MATSINDAGEFLGSIDENGTESLDVGTASANSVWEVI